MWLDQQMLPADSAAYTLPIALRFDGPLDVGRLAACLDAIAARHLILRARIVAGGGSPAQKFDVRPHIPLLVRPVSASDVAAALREEAARPFAFDSPPYIRALLLRVSAGSHVLALTMHHVICDGWSLDVLVTDLLRCYGPGAELTAPVDTDDSFLEYVRWEESPQGRAVLRANREFWAGRNPALDGHPDLPYASEARDQPARTAAIAATIDIPASVDRALAVVARRYRATTQAVWLAAFATTWHLITGTRRVPVLIPAANRPGELYERTVGPFVAPMPMLLTLDPAAGFGALVEQAADGVVEGSLHAAVALSGPAAGDCPAVVPEATFVVTGGRSETEVLPGLRVTPVPIRVQGTQTALTVQVDVRDGQVQVRFTGSPGRYMPHALGKLAQSYLRCLQLVAADPDSPLARLSLLSAADRRKLAAWGDGGAALNTPAVLDCFDQWAGATPGEVACWDGVAGATTYGQLAELADRMASVLYRLGVRRGSPVILQVAPASSYLAIVLAVWRLRGWVVPVSAQDPASRARQAADRTGARCLVTSHPSHDAPATAVAWVTVAELLVATRNEARLTAAAHVGHVHGGHGGHHPAELAYAVFTSGTTGQPKCVAVPHGALAGELAWRRQQIGLGPHDRVLQTIPLSFDPAFWQCFGPLTAGASVIFPGLDLGAEPGGLVQAAREHAATVVDVVPSLLAALRDDELRMLPSRVVFCGGEALPAGLAARWLEAGGGALYNQYGPSEACIDATSLQCDARAGETGTVPIGRPLPGVTLLVLDDLFRPVPPGTPGELFIAGDSLAWGYIAAPGETAERFLSAPAGPPGARMYRTGDRVRWSDGGYLEFLGRVDNQVKVRGHRVELEDVDSRLSALPGVAEAVTVLAGGVVNRLLAFVTVTAGLTPEEIKTELARTAPAYLVPAEIRVVPEIPVTPNGKADRAALANLARSTARAASPRNTSDPCVLAVCEVFARVFGLNEACGTEDLYELGGSSLGAAEVAAGLSARLGIDVPVRTVLTHSRASELARVLAGMLADMAREAETTIPDAGLPGPEQILVLDLERLLGRPAPPVQELVRLDSAVTQAEVASAVCELVTRHEALSPWHTDPSRRWEPCLRAPDRTASAELLTEWSQYGPVIEDCMPALQAVLLGGSDRSRRVLMRLARNRADGESLAILTHELRSLLASRPLETPPPSYRRYVSWRSRRAAARRAELESYWTAMLSGAVADPFADRRRQQRGFRNRGARAELSAIEYERITGCCKAAHATLTSWFMAALAQAVSESSAAPASPASPASPAAPSAGRLVVATPVSHRAGTRAALVGRATDLVPVALPAGASAAAAHQAYEAALEHADLPLLEIARIAGKADLGSRPPVCALAVIVAGASEDQPTVSPDLMPDGTVRAHWSEMDLVLHVRPTRLGTCELVLSGSEQLFQLPEISAWLERVCQYGET